jgi:hypothetical protein
MDQAFALEEAMAEMSEQGSSIDPGQQVLRDQALALERQLASMSLQSQEAAVLAGVKAASSQVFFKLYYDKTRFYRFHSRFLLDEKAMKLFIFCKIIKSIN